jgi:hypothetical protein
MTIWLLDGDIMKAKKYWILITIIVISLVSTGCDRKSTEKQDSAVVEQIKEEVQQLCSRYNAVTDWYKKLDIKEASFDTVLYTIQVQSVLLEPNERPYLFFVVINDIKKVNNKYVLIAEQAYPVDYRRHIYIHLRLTCDAEKVQRILERRSSYFDRYALLATIKSVEKPDLIVRPDIEYDLLAENNTFAETQPDEIYDYLDLKISCDNDNTFIATGKCEALVFVGKDDWMDDPSDYKRFLEIFDINKP